MVLRLPEVNFGSSNFVSNGLDLSEIFKPVQSYLICSNPESSNFTDSSYFTGCLEVLASFAGTAVEPG